MEDFSGEIQVGNYFVQINLDCDAVEGNISHCAAVAFKKKKFSVIFGCAAVGVFESHCDAVIQRSTVNGSHCAAVEERIGDCAAVTRLRKRSFYFRDIWLRRSGRNHVHCAAVVEIKQAIQVTATQWMHAFLTAPQ